MEDKIIVKYEKETYFMLQGVFILSIIGLTWLAIKAYQVAGLDVWPGLIGLAALCYLEIRHFITMGKIITLTPEGCTIKLFCWKKSYTWDQMKTKQWEDYSNSLTRIYQGGVFFSPYREREKFIIYPDKYCLLLSPHPFASVYIFFKVPGEEEIRKKSGKEDIPGYEADEKELREKFTKWGVEMDGV